MTNLESDLPPGVSVEAGRGYVAQVRLRPFPLKKKRFPFGTPLRVLETWLARTRGELEAARAKLQRVSNDPAGGRATFDDDVDRYLETLINPAMHKDTRWQFERWLKKAGDDFGRIPRMLISGDDWRRLVAKWERYGIPVTPDDGYRHRIVPPGPLAPDTVNKIRACFISFYNTLDGDKTAANPARAIPRRKSKAPEARGLDMDVALRIIDALPAGSRTSARLMLMCVLGLRPVEIMRIQPAKDWNRARAELVVRTAKGGSGRTVPLNTRATTALELLEARQAWGTFTSAPAARMFHAAVKAAGLDALEPLRPYDLRHSFGTAAYRATGDVKATGAALGHSNLRMTERYIGAAVDERVAKLYAAVDKTLPAVRKTKRARGAIREIK